MTADELYYRRTTHLAEIANFRAELCNCLGGELQHIKRINKIRKELADFADALESDFDELLEILQGIEKERKKTAIIAEICELKDKIRELESKL